MHRLLGGRQASTQEPGRAFMTTIDRPPSTDAVAIAEFVTAAYGQPDEAVLAHGPRAAGRLWRSSRSRSLRLGRVRASAPRCSERASRPRGARASRLCWSSASSRTMPASGFSRKAASASATLPGAARMLHGAASRPAAADRHRGPPSGAPRALTVTARTAVPPDPPRARTPRSGRSRAGPAGRAPRCGTPPRSGAASPR